jgi:hypothetical protein
MRNPNYKVGQYPVYDHYVDRYRMSSAILRGENTMSGNMSDLAGCKALLAEFVGNLKDQPGYFFQRDGDRYKMAVLPSLEQELKILDQKWANHRQEQINSGRTPLEDKPENMPKAMFEARMKIEAMIVVRKEEIHILEKRIAEFEKQKAEATNRVLVFGPRGHSHSNKDGIICDIDGQVVSVVNGYPTITEETSPYLNMKVSDYREVIIKAFKEHRKRVDANRLLQAQETARANGWRIPTEVSSAFGAKVNWCSLPAWPDTIDANLPNLEEVESERTT